jgi:hypothetical protein
MGLQIRPLRKRIQKVIWTSILNIVFWIAVPYYVGGLLASAAPGSPLTVPTFVYEFGIAITVLEAAAILAEGRAVSVPFLSTVSLLMAYYLWLATEGGNIAVAAGGTNIVLGFQSLVYVLMLPSIWGAIKAPLEFLVRRRSAQRLTSGPSPA